MPKAKAETLKGPSKNEAHHATFVNAPDALVRPFQNAIKDFPVSQQRLTFGFPAAYVNGTCSWVCLTRG